MGMVRKVYGRHYEIHSIYMEPGDLGHSGVARSRLYLILALKGSVVAVTDCNDIFEKISSAMKSRVATVPADYFIADAVDVQLEAQRTALTRKIAFRPKARAAHIQTSALQVKSLQFQSAPGTDLQLSPEQTGEEGHCLHQEPVFEEVHAGLWQHRCIFGRQPREKALLVWHFREDPDPPNEPRQDVHPEKGPMEAGQEHK